MTNPCPKCGCEENPPESPECRRCGVIFAKIRVRQTSPSLPPPLPRISKSPCSQTCQRDSIFHWGRGITLIMMLAWGIALLLSGLEPEGAGKELLHLVNLPFHEAGHLFFRPFGEFLTSLGGTLGQLLIPLTCLVVLLTRTRDPFGAAVCLWWLGENFMDLAPYINDARAGEMPLLGGNTGADAPYGFHDWEYLLTETDLLQHDHRIALLAHGTGAILMALAVVWGVLLLRRGAPRSETSTSLPAS